MRPRIASTGCAFLGLWLLALPAAHAGKVDGAVKEEAIYNGLSRTETQELPSVGDYEGSAKAGTKVPAKVPYEYNTVMACGQNGPNSDGGLVCSPALTACENVPDANGPYVRVFRRQVFPGQEPTGWRQVGTTCYPELVPGGASRPQLTLAMIRDAWSKTPFAKPALRTQPVGGRTLVTLPTYFEISWPSDGFQPDEVRTVTLLGQQVRIKPTFKSNNFVFGDGTSSGPTSSFGGPYPTGDITHKYDKAGTVTVSASTVYGGEFSVNGGAYVPIPGTATVAGPSQQLTIVTAKNRLVNE
ncbi:hypothetical protein FB554_3026 [Barrientosiimonas humi]|uniref:PKD domain-containing protein n=2 Tax=Barrientosiimonas humi TaxID=999931 RepID=A0A542XGB7_9MICO|nr:hypothetical protein FB554_3026 [Barrientosiimonas humi]CAG7571002.1 hypothetical protein BH39T_PBIAJDOK_00145 [Barrientosiimonas humi]